MSVFVFSMHRRVVDHIRSLLDDWVTLILFFALEKVSRATIEPLCPLRLFMGTTS